MIYQVRFFVPKRGFHSNQILQKTEQRSKWSKTSIFKALDMESQTIFKGVYDGRGWKGSGEMLTSIDPATNEVLAKIQGVSLCRMI